MGYYGKKHRKRIQKIETLWDNLRELNDLAQEYGINDIFQDNGAKILQQLIYLDFENLPGREGNDAVDANGVEWEMKSINLATSATGFSTNHHTNSVIISKYRQVPWSFSIYRGIELQSIYVMPPKLLEPIFKHWEEKLKTMSHINNPKIPVSFVEQTGICVYPIDSAMPLNPASITERIL